MSRYKVHQITDSSSLSSVQYKDDKHELHVVFQSGAKGYYSNISQTKFTMLMNSESKGKFLHANIKSNPKKHPFTRTGTSVSIVNEASDSIQKPKILEFPSKIEHLSSTFHKLIQSSKLNRSE